MRFTIGDGEFGEIYHMACAYVLDDSVTVNFKKFKAGQEFFDHFVICGKRQPIGKCAHAGDSANVIHERYFEGCMKSVCDAIRRKALADEWRPPPSIESLLTNDRKVLVWHRNKTYKCHRNSSWGMIRQLAALCRERNTEPILIGSSVPNSTCHDLLEFWDDRFFEEDSIAKQLFCIDALFNKGGTIANLGVMSGAMDGATMIFGHKTVFLARHQDATPRMQKVSASVPNLIWHQIEYTDNLSILTDSDLESVALKIWC